MEVTRTLPKGQASSVSSPACNLFCFPGLPTWACWLCPLSGHLLLASKPTWLRFNVPAFWTLYVSSAAAKGTPTVKDSQRASAGCEGPCSSGFWNWTLETRDGVLEESTHRLCIYSRFCPSAECAAPLWPLIAFSYVFIPGSFPPSYAHASIWVASF